MGCSAERTLRALLLRADCGRPCSEALRVSAEWEWTRIIVDTSSSPRLARGACNYFPSALSTLPERKNVEGALHVAAGWAQSAGWPRPQGVNNAAARWRDRRRGAQINQLSVGTLVAARAQRLVLEGCMCNGRQLATSAEIALGKCPRAAALPRNRRRNMRNSICRGAPRPA